MGSCTSCASVQHSLCVQNTEEPAAIDSRQKALPEGHGPISLFTLLSKRAVGSHLSFRALFYLPSSILPTEASHCPRPPAFNWKQNSRVSFQGGVLFTSDYDSLKKQQAPQWSQLHIDHDNPQLFSSYQPCEGESKEVHMACPHAGPWSRQICGLSLHSLAGNKPPPAQAMNGAWSGRSWSPFRGLIPVRLGFLIVSVGGVSLT